MKPQKQEHISTCSISLTFGLNFAPRRAASLNHRSARYLSPPSICSASSQTRCEAQSAGNGVAACKRPVPFGKARGGQAAPFPHVNQLPLSRRFRSNIEYPALVPRSYSDNLHHLNATTTNTINHSYTVNAKFQLPASRKPPQKRLTYLIRPKRQASDTLIHHDSHRTIKR